MSVQQPLVHEVEHSCVANSLWYLRNQTTPVDEFRRHSDVVSTLLVSEALRSLRMRRASVQTPLTKARGARILDDVVVVPVLRAGLAMLFGVLELIPQARVGFVGLERDEQTAVAREYYWKLPNISSDTFVLVVDPMLATGGSAVHVLRRVAEQKPRALGLVSVIAAPEGIAAVQKAVSGVEIFAGAVDERLNAQKYIVPGLGDYGDRYFGTVG